MDGTMPHLHGLMDRGLTARTRGIEGFFVGSTWPSLYTGTNPARHGIHYPLQITPGTYQQHWCANASFVRRKPFWSALSGAGRRVAVLDVPLTRLEHDLNGVHVVEWGGHDSLYGFHASPPELGEDIRARFGLHPLGPTCDRANRTAADYRAFTETLESGVRLKTSWTRELLARGGWDLFFQVFTEAHCAGHQCWHLHDPAHPAYDSANAGGGDDVMRRVYSRIDAAIGEILGIAGDARVVVFTAHGMSHWYGAQFLLHDILIRLGVFVPPPMRDGGTPRSVVRATLSATLRRLPYWLRERIARVRRRVAGKRSQIDVPAISLVAEKSLCFPLNNGLAVGGIRLNLIGREPQGTLSSGADADAFCDQLEDDLLEIVDERSGAPLIRRVLRTAQLYEGEYLDQLPDVLVEWNDELPTGSSALLGGAGATVRAHSRKIGVVEGRNGYGRSGEHRPGGWLVAAGPGIEQGRMDGDVSLLDLAPTFARMLGTELDGSDGHPIAELVRAMDPGFQGVHSRQP